MARIAPAVAISTALAMAAAAAATTLTIDKTIYLTAPAFADRYIALRTQAYKDALAAAADGRLLSHLPYQGDVTAPIASLVGLERPYRTKQCDLLPPAAEAAERMIRAANIELAGVARLKAQSCFRSIPEQVGIFCNGVRNRPTANCEKPALRAEVSAPPGYSEHATGYAADFVACGPASTTGCGGLNQQFADSKPGQWMIRHAREYGFELSFPCPDPSKLPCATKTVQGVSYEPWHWRWVGCTVATPGAAQARQIFADARRRFPASPGIADTAPPPVEHCSPPAP